MFWNRSRAWFKMYGLEIIRYIFREFDISIVMDADALNHISRDKNSFHPIGAP